MLGFVNRHDIGRVACHVGLIGRKRNKQYNEMVHTLKKLYPTCEIGVLLLIIEYSQTPIEVTVRRLLISSLNSFRLFYFSGFSAEDVFACSPSNSCFFHYGTGLGHRPIKVIISKTQSVEASLSIFKNRYVSVNIREVWSRRKKIGSLAEYITNFIPKDDIRIVEVSDQAPWDREVGCILTCVIETQVKDKRYLFPF
jgi:hypothetical protein